MCDFIISDMLKIEIAHHIFLTLALVYIIFLLLSKIYFNIKVREKYYTLKTKLIHVTIRD